jgi:chromosome segregation protein
VRLKEIRLYGFKTFAERTCIDVDSSIVALVGPNGCGKSNLVDAILWALGESSPRVLRGQSSTDVIFAGSAKRKALGFAEVILTFDNEDGTLPVPTAEVTVGRRVDRSGESTYTINGKVCRQKDIYDLFAGTGLGRTGYAVVNQNDVAAALFASAQERRVWIDEAAGIQRYRTRKAEALKRLEATLHHLQRVTDVINELERQLEPLRAEAEVARVYREKREALQKLESGVLIQECAQLNQEIALAQESIAQKRRSAGDLRERADVAESRLQQLVAESRSLDAELEKLQNEFQQQLQAVERAEARRAVAQQRLQDLLEMRWSTEEVQRAASEQRRLLAEAIADVTKHIQREEEKISLLSQVLLETETRSVESERKVAELNRALAAAKDAEKRRLAQEVEERHAKHVQEKLKTPLGQWGTSLERLFASLQDTLGRTTRVRRILEESQREHYSPAVAEAKEQVAHLEVGIEGILAELQQAIQDLKDLLASLEASLPSPERSLEAPEDVPSLSLDQLESERNSALKEMLASQADAGQARRALEDSRERLKAFQDRLAQLQSQLDRVSLQGPSTADDDWEMAKASAEASVADTAREVLREKEVYERCEEKLESARRRRQELQAEMEALREQVSRQREEARLLEQMAYEEDIKRARAETRRSALLARLLEEFSVSESEVEERARSLDLPPDAPRIAARLRREIRELGDVNTGAVEAYERLHERYEILCREREDVLKAKKELDQSVEELDRVTRDAFAETFEKVNQAFREMFCYFFGGGDARLVLTNPESLLETGVDIEVVVPGKKTQRLELLSGGERALAACALVFALLKVRPSPVVILDELDAPMDVTNVERFVQVIHEFSARSQFIVVTHNPVTIYGSPVWYGISMQEPGVSTVVPYRDGNSPLRVGEGEGSSVQSVPSASRAGS